MDIEIAMTQRGFLRGEFVDRYGEQCSIQESSLATEAALWLGVDERRMHLTQGMAASLVPLIAHFVDTGQLPRGHAPGHSGDGSPEGDKG